MQSGFLDSLCGIVKKNDKWGGVMTPRERVIRVLNERPEIVEELMQLLLALQKAPELMDQVDRMP